MFCINRLSSSLSDTVVFILFASSTSIKTLYNCEKAKRLNKSKSYWAQTKSYKSPFCWVLSVKVKSAVVIGTFEGLLINCFLIRGLEHLSNCQSHIISINQASCHNFETAVVKHQGAAPVKLLISEQRHSFAVNSLLFGLFFGAKPPHKTKQAWQINTRTHTDTLYLQIYQITLSKKKKKRFAHSYSGLLLVTWQKLTFGGRGFCHFYPTWNSISTHLRLIT